MEPGRSLCRCSTRSDFFFFFFRVSYHWSCQCRQTTTADVPDFDWDVEEGKHEDKQPAA